MTRRQVIHHHAVRRVAAALRARAHSVVPLTGNHDLLVDELVTVQVRAATARTRTHTVRWRDKLYHYAYTCLDFNTHRHGKSLAWEALPDFWILVQEPKGRAWIVPGALLHQTKTVHVYPTLRSRAGRRLKKYEARWDLIQGARRPDRPPSTDRAAFRYLRA